MIIEYIILHSTRFSYASTSTALPSTIKDHLVNIIRDAESNTARGEMAGILIYGNNHYFHCIEAPALTTNKFYHQVVHNQRHKQFKLLQSESINDHKFAGWQIKYFIKEEALQQFFLTHYGQSKFDPYLLEGKLLEEFIELQTKSGYQQLSELSNIKPKNAIARSSGRVINTYSVGFMLSAVITILLLYLINYYMGIGLLQPIYAY